MSPKAPTGEKPQNSRNPDGKKPVAPVKAKSAEREMRLADALRENLRKRKVKSRKQEAGNQKD